MKAILYIAHGSRSRKGSSEANTFLKRVMDRIFVPIQEISFLELTEPSVEEGFERCIEQGATEVTVVPIFLFAAGHIKKDIPDILQSLRERYPQIPIIVRDAFGVKERILGAVAEMVRHTVDDLAKEDCILIVGRGSSDPAIHGSFAEISQGIQARLGVEKVSVCYLAATEPRFQQGLSMILDIAPKRIIVIPYLLFSGVLLTEINQLIRMEQKQGKSIINTGPLTRHNFMEQVVIESTFGKEIEYKALSSSMIS